MLRRYHAVPCFIGHENLVFGFPGLKDLARLHARVWAECQTFLDAAVAARERSAPPLDRAIRWAERRLGDLGL